MRRFTIIVFGMMWLTWGSGVSSSQENPAAQGFRADVSDQRAIQLADETMAAMGGRSAWDATRYLSWRFFGRRSHWWDKWTGDVRIQSEDTLILMNVQTKQGRAWVDGQEVGDSETLADLMDKGYAWWVNDSYWVFMPYKLKDSGVALRYKGEREMENGRPAQVVELTFENVGLTPNNRYEVMIDNETSLVGEWSYFANANDAEPKFTMPWADWKKVGQIMLASHRGRGNDWELAVYETLPRSVFEEPEPVSLP